MSVDKFGRHHWTLKSRKGEPGVGFQLTTDGHYDINHKHLVNVADPTDAAHAANKNYVDLLVSQVQSKATGIIQAVPGLVESKIAAYTKEYCLFLNKTKNVYDAEKKRIVNVGVPKEAGDVCTKEYANEQIAAQLQQVKQSLESRIDFLQQQLLIIKPNLFLELSKH